MKRLFSIIMLVLSVAFLSSACGDGGTSSDQGGGGTNSAPGANAGPDRKVAPGSLVTLDGSGSSDTDNDPLTYSWSFAFKPGGSTATLSSATISKPTFTADKNGFYVLTLIVNDGQADSTADSVTISANTYDFGPINESVINTSSACAAGTVISGGTINNQKWTADNSPYVIQGDITILNGATLTIDPGVTVCLASTDSMAAGVDTAKVEITVNGALTVAGSAEFPVIFRSVDATSAMTWRGIIVNSSSTGSTFNYSYIANAYHGINSAGPLTVSNSVFMNNTYGVYLSAAGTITSSVFLKNTSTGVYSGSNASSQMTNLLIYQNGSVGVYLYYPLNVSIYNCTIDGNGSYGVNVYGNSSSTATIKNSIIARNGSYGVYGSVMYGPISLSYNNVWGNSTNYSGVSPGAGSITSNPMYVSLVSPLDYSLAAGSPSIDVGDDLTANVPTDIRGTTRPRNGDGIGGAVIDLGAYEM